MGSRRKLVVDAAIAVAIAGSVLAITALAHSDGEAYPTQWERDQTVVYRFDNKFPGEWKNPVVRAAKEWNKTKASLTLKKAKGKTRFYPVDECGSHYQDNVISEQKLNGPIGFTTWCLFDDSSEDYSFQIAFEKSLDWYTGKGKPEPGTWDLFTAALHEFGHATGRSDHYRDGAAECEGTGGHVMCSAISAGEQRHLEKHDKHTFESAY